MPGQTVYYRISATNSLGLSTGSTQSFQTAREPEALTAKWLGAGLRLDFTASSGFAYRVWASTNLITWSELGLATDLGGNGFRFNDPASTHLPTRFYRIELPR